MTIPEFIQAATEGGYGNGALDHMECELGKIEHYVLDPKAWEAVGKVKGWEEQTPEKVWEYTSINGKVMLLDVWETNMHSMVYALCSGKSLEEYIATL